MSAPVPGATGRLPDSGVARRRWWWVPACAVAGLVVGLVLGFAQSPTYESTAYLTVTADDVDDPNSVARSTQALARLATSPSIVGEPLREAGLAEQADDPRLFVRVQAAPDAPLISVTGTSDDPRTAQRTADVVSRALVGVDAFDPYDVTTIGPALLPDDPTTPGWLLPAGGAGIGAAVAMVLATTLPGGSRRRGAVVQAPVGD
ncbi:Capsular polysaccharide biosynthesis protein [Blastococcus aurantiacus]|uniref:Capsular polysaccharide biosynthesis protein n=1 Tax=Blastococcus aurantiacus TaxID=1550231 RepID=A0A1G7MU63_9ACTN|nr:Wzz/FepE/Etk N-terminal domain-containing protein [Blastococcus aurantiacus]SDF64669.1 Capsular polysaccharide biosynthesis protein [Blastococcus aurantiacus]